MQEKFTFVAIGYIFLQSFEDKGALEGSELFWIEQEKSPFGVIFLV